MRSVRAELLSSTGWFGSVHASEFEAELTRRSALRLGEPREKASPRILAAAAMPSVGMRRTTRVFGVVKGADVARVLRSGRRLWPDSTEGKLRKHGVGDDWLKMVKNSGGGGGGGRDSGIIGGGFEAHGWTHRPEIEPKKSLPAPVLEIEVPKPEARSSELFRIVYTRKRKNSRVDSDVRRFGRQFIRRKLNSGESVAVVHDDVPKQNEVVNVVAGSSPARNYFLAQFLWVVLVYMTRAKMRLSDLFAFLASEPLRRANSSSGIDIFLDHPSTRRQSSCKIFGSGKFVPLFSVDFPAVPLCFMNMYLDLFFQPKRQLRLQNNSNQISYDSDDEALLSLSTNKADASPFHRGSKLSGRITQYRAGLLSRGIQKRRSFRRRRARNLSLRPNGLASDLISFRKNAGSFSTASSNKVRRSLRSSSAKNVKEISSRTEGLAQNRVPASCSANVLVTEPEKCYREGAVISLEMSPSGEWFIAVKKDGITKFTHKAEKVMKPNFTNRFTHATTWSGDNELKLEFPDKKDWMIFKDLYKECFDRNVPIPGVKSIPIPGVNEVSETGERQNDVFRRPDSYISVKDDELQRVMTRKAPSYDLDSEDELWLEKFNADSSAENETCVLEYDFELMIDAFEKAAYCGQYHLSEEKPPTELALHLGSRNAIDGVYSYWMKKRKQKPSSFLLRVFRSLPERRAPVVPIPYFRKKRSVKRPSQVKRPKQYGLFQGFTADREAVEEQRSQLKVEEAKASAQKAMELALHKRRVAQQLMNNADLATYKAVVALRIAEGAESSVAAEHFLD